MDFKTIKELFIRKTAAFGKLKYLCTIGGDFYTYEQFGEKTKEVSALLLKNNIMGGDKVAILSQNMPNWGVAFFSCLAYNRIAVPLLPDFSEMEIANIIGHSETKALFVSKKLFRKISSEVKEKLELIIEIDNFTILKSNAKDTAESDRSLSLDSPEFTPKEEELATIIYTSGTTGNSKGVMLSHKNLCSHLKSAMQLRPSFEWDVWLSILPLSHTLENSLSLLLPFSSGASVYYLDKAPTPTALLQAFKVVKPTTILVVPLIIEKIYKNSILPKIKAKKITATMYKTTIGRKLVHLIVGKQMREMFGGRVRFFGIGGAKLDGIVERFLYEAKFPYAIGYGLTECCPLLAGAIPSMVKWQTTGPAVPGVQLRIDNINPETGEGEIVAKGENIMMGYYKNPEATAEAFTEDGWFRTQDLGYIDEKGWLAIRGRLKNMILGPSGENIYPEEIETVINSHIHVAESLVTASKGGLIARIHPSPDKIAAFNNKKDELYQAYLTKKVELIQEYEAKKAELIKYYANKKTAISESYNNTKTGLNEAYELKKAEINAKCERKMTELAQKYEQKKRELVAKASEYGHSYEKKMAELHTMYERSKAEINEKYELRKHELAIKAGEYSQAYDQKRRELYDEYAKFREDAYSAYRAKIEDIKESMSDSFEALKKEVSEYVNSKVNKFSRITEIYIQHEAFQKTATSKIKRYLYN